jgi:hypothetical protein
MGRSNPNNQVSQHETITSLDHVMRWGKYKGKSLRFLIEFDPQYILWAADKVEHFDIDHKLQEEIEERLAIWRP